MTSPLSSARGGASGVTGGASAMVVGLGDGDTGGELARAVTAREQACEVSVHRDIAAQI